MRVFLLLFLVVSNLNVLHSQQQQQSLPPSKIYAIVIGISKYENGIPQLDYAHNDAKVFADYLRSKAGGSVPEDHIRLMVNEEATYSSIYNAFNWLLDTCEQNDLVYFYFSGHGDMENNTIYKLGFLLAANSPRFNYINNAVRIEDLNNFANTLSVKNKAKVVLITDACHSGNLAGADFRGRFLVDSQLRAVQSSEVRITSCEPDQLSNEDEGWGGGRGVFSYYLVKGLEGLADNQQDGIITLNEIKNYLNTSFANDKLLAVKPQKQNPVVEGANLPLAKVDPASVNMLRQQDMAVQPAAAVRPILKQLNVQPQTYLFELIKNDSIDVLADYDLLSTLSKDEIPFAFINMVMDSLPKLRVVAFDSAKIDLLKRTLKQNTDAVKRFNEKLVTILSDRTQEIINLYLSGNEAELERRRYYNSFSNGYDVYPKMLSCALKLIPPDDYLHRILEIKLHYFTGVAARLKVPTVEDPKPLLDLAMAEQKKAFALEENAAYIHIELGTLYDYKNDFTTAEKFYLRASEIAPTWALPWANLTGLYAQTKNYKKAFDASAKAIALQKDFQGSYINTGVVYQRTGNLLKAEELYYKSIKMNSRHYLPFENLGYAYLDETEYELADRYFFEAEERKKGFHNPRLMKFPKPVEPFIEVLPAHFCDFDSLDVGKNDVLGHFAWGMDAFYRSDFKVAEREYKKVIALDNKNPLAFHFLGKILFYDKRWQEADLIFNYAVRYYLDDSLFNQYLDSMTRLLPVTKSKDCIVSEFEVNHYYALDDHYFLASMYQSWNHFLEAEAEYRLLIKEDPSFVGAYYKLWMMLESIGRYKDAETLIRQYDFYDRDISSRELLSFYKRMLERFPGNTEWLYKAGSFLYFFGADHPDGFVYDKKEILSDFDTVVFTNLMNPQIQIDKNVVKKFIIPGTGESFIVADKIFRPFTAGINYLEKADSLIQNDDDASADINNKIGDMYKWQRLAEKAMPHYKKAVELKPDNANTRIKLVETYSAIYYLSDALAQLDSLKNRNEINFPMQVLMAKYCIHSGRFADADSLLTAAKNVHPFKVKEITDLNGRLNLLSNKPKQALAFYNELLNNDPKDALVMYTIARLYAKMKNKNEALKWLKNTINNGFVYDLILKYDNVWNDYRTMREWKKITGIVETTSF